MDIKSINCDVKSKSGEFMENSKADVDESVEGIKKAVIEMIRHSDRDGAKSLLDEWGDRYGYGNLYYKVLDPVLTLIGKEWHDSESFSLAHAYVAAKVTEDALQKIMEKNPASTLAASTRPVVIGNIEDDFHGLGRKMIGTFLRARGWTVYDLGNDVLPKDFVDKALEKGARVIGVSAMMMATARNILRLRKEIDQRGLNGKIQLAVGGAVFQVSPGLAEEVGGDGTASNVLEVPDLFEKLWKRSLNMEEKHE